MGTKPTYGLPHGVIDLRSGIYTDYLGDPSSSNRSAFKFRTKPIKSVIMPTSTKTIMVRMVRFTPSTPQSMARVTVIGMQRSITLAYTLIGAIYPGQMLAAGHL